MGLKVTPYQGESSTVKGRVRAVRQAALKLCAETAKGS